MVLSVAAETNFFYVKLLLWAIPDSQIHFVTIWSLVAWDRIQSSSYWGLFKSVEIYPTNQSGHQSGVWVSRCQLVCRWDCGEEMFRWQGWSEVGETRIWFWVSFFSWGLEGWSTEVLLLSHCKKPSTIKITEKFGWTVILCSQVLLCESLEIIRSHWEKQVI